MTPAFKLSEFSLLSIDGETTAKLAEYQKFMTEYVGPMARIFIKEVVLCLSRDGAFSADKLDEAVAMLYAKIDDEEGKCAFNERFGNELFD